MEKETSLQANNRTISSIQQLRTRKLLVRLGSSQCAMKLQQY